MNDRDSEKLDTIATDVAVLAATQVEMSKRQDDQAKSIKVLNDSHVNNEVAHAELKGSIGQLDTRLDGIEGKIEKMQLDLPNTIKVGLTITGIFLTVLQLVLKYVI